MFLCYLLSHLYVFNLNRSDRWLSDYAGAGKGAVTQGLRSLLHCCTSLLESSIQIHTDCERSIKSNHYLNYKKVMFTDLYLIKSDDLTVTGRFLLKILLN